MAHKVTVNVANLNLPNGFYYQPGQSVVLEDEDFSKILPSAFTDNHLTDNGIVVTGVAQVTTQGAAQSAPVALTSAQAGAAPTQAQFNALQTDVATLRTELAALITALSVTGGALV